MKKIHYLIIQITIVVLGTLLYSCSSEKEKADAYGNFTADEILISSEKNGKILEFNIKEGQTIDAGTKVALIDTSVYALQMEEIKAQRSKIAATIYNIEAQKEVLLQQQNNLNVDLERIKNLVKSGAATQKQLDDIQGQQKVLEKQLAAFNAQKAAIDKENDIVTAKQLLLLDQIDKCTVTNPCNGTVLETYANKGELTAMGKPLYKIANLSTITLEAYISGGQLYRVKSGDTCTVAIDKGEKEYISYKGTVSWIADKAEFTPKIIQTKEERVDMVYAIKIRVENDGKIKLGMPGEVILQ